MNLNQRSHNTFKLIERYWPWLEVKECNADRIPIDGAALLAEHHQSGLDIFISTMCVSGEVLYMAKSELFRIPLLAWYMRTCRAFPVKRGTADRGAIRMAARLLDEGNNVCVYAEGTRRRGDLVHELEPGIISIVKACKNEPPVYPIGICYRARGLKLKVGFFVGEPLYLSQLGDLGESDDRTKILDAVRAQMQYAQNRAVALMA